jgi:predicted aspartyl protease
LGDVIVRALVDTGASQSLIDPRLVRQIGLRESGKGSIVGVGTKSIEVALASIDSAAIGLCALESFKAGVLDLTNLRIGVQLILGINAFHGYRLQFDFASGRLYLLS